MSVFTPFKLAGLACVGVGGTCSMVYAGSSLLDFSQVEADDDSVIQTIADKFSTRLISKSVKNEIWEKRLQKLRGDKDKNLDNELKNIRDKQEKTKDDLRIGCEESKVKPHEGDEFKLVVEGVEAYCTYNIEDQANRVMQRSKTDVKDGELVNKSFVNAKRESLSEDLQAVYDKVKGHEDTSPDLQTGCFGKYDKPFNGKEDPLYKSVTKFCAIVKAPKTLTTGPAASEPQRSASDGSGGPK